MDISILPPFSVEISSYDKRNKTVNLTGLDSIPEGESCTLSVEMIKSETEYEVLGEYTVNYSEAGNGTVYIYEAIGSKTGDFRLVVKKADGEQLDSLDITITESIDAEISSYDTTTMVVSLTGLDTIPEDKSCTLIVSKFQTELILLEIGRFTVNYSAEGSGTVDISSVMAGKTGDFRIRLMDPDNKELGVYYFTSSSSTPIVTAKTVQNIQLGEGENAGIATWDSYTGATQYTVKVYSNDALAATVTLTTAEIDLVSIADKLVDGHTHTISVTAEKVSKKLETVNGKPIMVESPPLKSHQ